MTKRHIRLVCGQGAGKNKQWATSSAATQFSTYCALGEGVAFP